MTTQKTPPLVQTGLTQPTTPLGRIWSLVEVLLAFAVVHVVYRSFKHFTALGQVEVAQGLNFSAGTTMILFTVVLIQVRRRTFAEYGLTLARWQYNLNIGLLWAVLMVAGVLFVLAVVPIHFDPVVPPDLRRALVFPLATLLLHYCWLCSS